MNNDIPKENGVTLQTVNEMKTYLDNKIFAYGRFASEHTQFIRDFCGVYKDRYVQMVETDEFPENFQTGYKAIENGMFNLFEKEIKIKTKIAEIKTMFSTYKHSMDHISEDMDYLREKSKLIKNPEITKKINSAIKDGLAVELACIGPYVDIPLMDITFSMEANDTHLGIYDIVSDFLEIERKHGAGYFYKLMAIETEIDPEFNEEVENLIASL
jgi:hypothetical protein